MANVFIICGIEGHARENWFPWLKKELEKCGCMVFIPRFPNVKKPKLREWSDYFKKFGRYYGEDSIAVGHSLGVPFLLAFLEANKAKAAFFVAGYAEKTGNKFDPRMKTFNQRKFNWKKIRENCSHFFVYHSDNDPYLKLSLGKHLAKNLRTRLILVKGAGHFNSAAGYKKFPLLLEKIKSRI